MHIGMQSSLSTAQTRSTFLICCGCQHTTARSIFCILPSTHHGQFHRMGSFIQGLIILPWHFHKQEMKIYHSEHNYRQESSLQPFSVHYSANNEVKTASSHHSPISTIGTVLYSTSCISYYVAHRKPPEMELYSWHCAGEIVFISLRW